VGVPWCCRGASTVHTTWTGDRRDRQAWPNIGKHAALILVRRCSLVNSRATSRCCNDSASELRCGRRTSWVRRVDSVVLRPAVVELLFVWRGRARCGYRHPTRVLALKRLGRGGHQSRVRTDRGGGGQPLRPWRDSTELARWHGHAVVAEQERAYRGFAARRRTSSPTSFTPARACGRSVSSDSWRTGGALTRDVSESFDACDATNFRSAVAALVSRRRSLAAEGCDR